MQSESPFLGFSPPSTQRALPVRTASAVVAVAAFAAIAFRQSREDAVTVAASSGDDAAPRTVRVEATLDTTLGDLVARVRSFATAIDGEVVRLSCSEDPSLAVTVRLPGLHVDDGPLAAPFRNVVSAFERRATRLGDVQLLDPRERKRILDLGIGGDAPELAAPALLHDLFAETARRFPERIAVRCRGVDVPYAELHARASRLAAALRARGIGPGACVALWLPRSIEVYVAILGVLASGAAYVPIDPETPRERLAGILLDARAAAVLTTSSMSADALGCAVLALDADWERALPPFTDRVRAPVPEDVAYVIYTSGSTGKPKGVAVTHANVVHLVRAEQRLFPIAPEDRVFQGFSIAFDAAVEEIWLAFAAGATLVVGTKDVILSDLPGYLRAEGVTVLSTVPTLLASIDSELPGVRLLIVGGEACAPALVDRWASGRAMFNTYGPTEATVIATYARMRAGAHVTIGRALPNYRVHVVDRAGHLAPAGVAGEIVIGGAGVACGYVGPAEMTSARFVTSRFDGRRVYKTGDLGRVDREGNIEFLGRIDEQIKLRGFRIELGEIEAALVAAGASHAAVVVREDTPGVRELVAFVAGAEPGALVRKVRASLPPYMVPAHVEALASLPTSTSGKIDKRALPAPSRRRASVDEAHAPRGDVERAIAAVWSDLLGVRVARDQDFFRDLAGDSMLAARAVSRLRQSERFASISVVDLYEQPTVAGLAVRAAPRPTPPSAQVERAAKAASAWRHRACAAAQAVGLYGVFGAYSVHWLAPYLAYVALRHADASVFAALCASAAVLIGVQPLLLVVALAAKWLVIGRYRPGRYPLWGLYYLRFWLVDRLVAIAPTTYLVGTPLLGAYYRLLGAKIGKDVHLASDDVRCFDLVTIGDGATLGIEASVTPYAIEEGALVVGSVRVGARCVVGARSSLALDTTMHDDAQLGELSLLASGADVPHAEAWAGSPARWSGPADRSAVATPRRTRRAAMTALYALASALLPAFAVTALLPGLVGLNALEARVGARALAAAPLVAASFVVLLCAEIALLKRVVWGRAKAGRHDLFSAEAFRRWLFDRAMAVSLDVVGGLYATLFLAPWYRALGVTLGRNAEVSTASSLVPDLVEIGDESFIADCVSLGTPRIGRGWIHLEPTRVGRRAFVGNSAVVAAGARVGDDALVGCLSASPPVASGAWFGSPPIALPNRQESAAFPAATTYRPTPALVAQRLAIETLRVTLPTTCFVVLTCLLLDAAVALHEALPLGVFVAAFPLLYAAFGVAAALIVIAVKWMVLSRHRPGEKPLWCTFVWRNELVTAMHENLADPFFNELLLGTPFAAWFFRALGAKIGRRVYMGTTQLTEYDLVEVGDDACLGANATLQTHLFEDRVMKMSALRVGRACAVGAQSVVLYDTSMEPESKLGPLSLLMKGETLPRRTAWIGSPARRVRARVTHP